MGRFLCAVGCTWGCLSGVTVTINFPTRTQMCPSPNMVVAESTVPPPDDGHAKFYQWTRLRHP
ncbi:hypothetical protein PF008_g3684 [Phytophthora fragariae]|uniref:Secreted protein n=1 Tax=Phytophthora fragariae TaxID=53985 RepID=A0A6G0SFG2_9STRA|nr:hypothetical protein PF008_g3684 [Phytophthora fragariae]